MPETQSPIAVESTSTAAEATDATFDIDTIGVEFEYPIARNPENAPATYAEDSTPLRNMVWYGEEEADTFGSRGGDRSWPISPNEIPEGQMDRDHVGAEITSAQLDLHTTQPEAWFVGSIQRAEDMGYSYAASGSGDTCFGMHLHLSEVPQRKAEGLLEISRQPWFRTFICSSVGPDSADPWRHGGVNTSGLSGERNFDRQRVVNNRRGEGHYEWRLPEPVMPDHFEMVMHFLRLLETDGVAEARQYARGRVDAADERLTAVQQYQMYRDRDDDYVDRVRTAADGTASGVNRQAARFLINLMETGQ